MTMKSIQSCIFKKNVYVFWNINDSNMCIYIYRTIYFVEFKCCTVPYPGLRIMFVNETCKFKMWFIFMFLSVFINLSNCIIFSLLVMWCSGFRSCDTCELKADRGYLLWTNPRGSIEVRFKYGTQGDDFK